MKISLFTPRWAALCATLILAAPLALSQAPPGGQPQNRRFPDTWAGQQASQEWATQKLAASPRRNEWVSIPDGDRKLRAWVVYPQAKGKAPVVIVLHEVFGLTDSTRNTADEIAALGYIAIAPDMLSGRGPDGGNVESFADSKITSNALTGLSNEAVNSDLNALGDYAAKMPMSTGKFAIVGLSWGGGAAFRYAMTEHRKDLKAVCVFFDVGPPTVTQSSDKDKGLTSLPVTGISVPVYGFYGSKDTRVMNSLQATKDAMAAAGKKYDPVVYDGADHAFMRVGDSPNANPENKAAVEASLARLGKVLKENLQ